MLLFRKSPRRGAIHRALILIGDNQTAKKINNPIVNAIGCLIPFRFKPENKLLSDAYPVQLSISIFIFFNGSRKIPPLMIRVKGDLQL
jgi:hypothetical protein